MNKDCRRPVCSLLMLHVDRELIRSDVLKARSQPTRPAELEFAMILCRSIEERLLFQLKE